MAALYVLSRVGRIEEHIGWVYAAQFVKATGIVVATGYMWALVPEVIAYSERLTGRRVAGIVNAIVGVFFRAGMALGRAVTGWVLAWTGYRVVADADGGMSLPTDPRAWLWTMIAFAAAAVVLLVFSFTQTKERVVMKAADAAQVRVADIWREFRRNGPLRWLALFFVAAFALMSVGNAAGAYFMNGLESQSPLAQEGVRWLVCVIPSILISAAAFVISRYRV
jgi:Na+/melibiose symporter-like transporter